MNFLKKNEKWILGVLGILGLIGAICMLFVAAPRADAGYKRAMDVIIGLLMLLLFGLCLSYFLLLRDKDPHFFLFDRVKKKNLPLNKLTFPMVNERMNYLETQVCNSTEELWKKNILENTELGYRNVYRPLLAWKMVYDLADRDVDSEWEHLYEVSPEILASLCRALEDGGAGDFAKSLYSFVSAYQAQSDEATREKYRVTIRKFICNGTNMKYIRGKMLEYIKKNVELFY